MKLSRTDIASLCKTTESAIDGWIAEGLPCVQTENRSEIDYIELLTWMVEHDVVITSSILEVGESAVDKRMSLYFALKAGKVQFDVKGTTREEVMRAVVNAIPVSRKTNRQMLADLMIARDRVMSTAIGHGIAVPHVRNPEGMRILKPSISVCFLAEPVDFQALDGKPVSTLFVLMIPSVKKHLVLLSRLVFCLQSERLRACLMRRVPRETILAAMLALEARLVADGGHVKEIPASQ